MTGLAEEVASALFQAHNVLDAGIRTAMLSDVWGRRPPPFGVSRHDNAFVDIGNIARACEEYGVLSELLDVASKYVPPRIAQNLNALLATNHPELLQIKSLRALLPNIKVSLDELATLCALSEPGYAWKSEDLQSLESAVDVFAQMPGRIGDQTALTRFLIGVSSTQPPEVEAILTRWISAGWGISIDRQMSIRKSYIRAENAASQNNAVLVVEMAPRKKSHYVCQAWLWREIGDILPWDRNPTEVAIRATDGDHEEEDNDDLQRVVSNVFDWACEQAGKRWAQMSIEFILPRELLCRRVEQLQVKFAAIKDANLGLRFPVVVRPYERQQHYAALCDIWTNNWKKIVDHGGHLQFVPVRGGLTALQLDATTARLNDLEYAHCLVFTFVPSAHTEAADQDALIRLFGSGGSAAAIWSRKDVELSGPLVEEFNSRPADQVELPRFGKGLRVRSVIDDLEWAEDLIVLWDDPNRLPPDRALAAAFTES